MDGPLIGRVVLYFALMWSLFVSIKSFYEAYKTNKSDKFNDVMSKSSVVLLIAIGFYSLFNIFAYVWFDIEATELRTEDRSIGVFNILYMNVIWLYVIFRHRQSRSKLSRNFKIMDLLKF